MSDSIMEFENTIDAALSTFRKSDFAEDTNVSCKALASNPNNELFISKRRFILCKRAKEFREKEVYICELILWFGLFLRPLQNIID